MRCELSTASWILVYEVEAPLSIMHIPYFSHKGCIIRLAGHCVDGDVSSMMCTGGHMCDATGKDG